MMHHPEETKNQSRSSSGHSQESDDNRSRVKEVHTFLEDSINGIAAAAIKGHFMISGHVLDVIVEVLGQHISHDIDRELSALESDGDALSVYPRNRKEFCEVVSERITDSLRIKPRDFAGELRDVLRPHPLPAFLKGDLNDKS